MAALARIQPPEDEADRKAAPRADEDGATMSEQDILALLTAEKANSIGFENGAELDAKRRTSLEYSKGEMKDVPSLPNRSKACSTDVIDAIETALPDIIEIFTGGEDVASFRPTGQEDEEAAKQETEYVHYVAFQKLNAFMLLYAAFKDALQVDTGVLETYWQDEEAEEEETYEGATVLQIQKLIENGAEIVSMAPAGMGKAAPEGEEAEEAEAQPQPMQGQQAQAMGQMQPDLPLFDVVAKKAYDRGCIKSAAVDPSNLTVASDATLDLEATTYVAVRSFPRAQALLDQGFDKAKVDQLTEYTAKGNDQTDPARDQASESTATNTHGGGGTDSAVSPLRTVEVHKHWLRADLKGTGKSQLWRIQTDAECKVILAKRVVSRIGLAVFTPFITPHRFYGTSLADKLVEIQKIKTALLRLMLDSGYFAMNQRMEVSESKASENTLKDLMRNEPGMPIRSKTGDAVRPISAGQLGFEPYMALEYVSTMAEARTGIARNAQGLKPDTLHDTASGAMALMSMAQKRIRMIARVFAETGVKKWFLDIHALSRTQATRAEKVRLRGEWVDVDPSAFGDRADMAIEVGVGSGGRDQELAVMSKILDMQKEIMVNAQGEAPVTTWKNVYAALKRFCERAGLKAPELFFTDPEQAAAEAEKQKAERAAQGIPEPEPPKDPKMVEVEAKAQAKQAEMQMDAQHKAQQSQLDEAHRTRQAELDAQLKREESERAAQERREQAVLDAQIKREEMAAEQQLKREQMAAELNLKREQLTAELALKRELEMAKLEMMPKSPTNGSTGSSVHLGGEAGA